MTDIPQAESGEQSKISLVDSYQTQVEAQMEWAMKVAERLALGQAAWALETPEEQLRFAVGHMEAKAKNGSIDMGHYAGANVKADISQALTEVVAQEDMTEQQQATWTSWGEVLDIIKMGKEHPTMWYHLMDGTDFQAGIGEGAEPAFYDRPRFLGASALFKAAGIAPGSMAPQAT